MADSNIQPYPLQFDSSQWLNKFSPLSGQSIPFPAQYRGTPTDAHGRPIQSYLDAQAAHDAWSAPPATQAPPVTLNTSPYPSLATMNSLQRTNALAGLQPSGQAYPTSSGGTFGADALLNRQFAAFGSGTPAQSTAAPQAAAAAPTNPIDMNQAYLDALSNPGHVTTPGANVPQSPLPSNQSGVLQQFLANWQKGGGQTRGAGNYDNSGFFKALQGQV